MRPKIVASLLLLVIGLIALAFVIKGVTRAAHKGTPGAEMPTLIQTVAPGNRGRSPVGGSALIPKEMADNLAAGAQPVESHGRNSVIARDPVQERVDRIRGDLDQINNAVFSGKEDPAAVNTILGLLTNPEPEVRKAALSAVVYFDVPAAIVRLKELANQQQDPRQKVAILDALELMQPAQNPSEGLTNIPSDRLPQGGGRSPDADLPGSKSAEEPPLPDKSTRRL